MQVEIKTTTKQVQKYHKTLNIKLDFNKGNKSELRKQKIQEEVSLLQSAEKKTAVLTPIVKK